LEKYELDKASRPIVDFVDDFSTWYIRRSRERFKSEDKNTSEAAIRCTAFVLVELSKLMAPITPFLAEDIYKKVRLMDHNGGYESVHLASWPEYKSSDIFNDSELIKNMQISRDLVSKALELRQKAGIKVRQPLAYLSIPQQLSQEFLDIIADEVNVKKIEVRDKFELDTNITPELKQEGIARDIIRAIQDARKEAGLQPKDFVVLHISVDDSTKEVIENMKEIITKPTGVKEIIYSQNTDLNSGELWRIQSLVREE
jgi:isoleucyl-tRNA synthetase